MRADQRQQRLGSDPGRSANIVAQRADDHARVGERREQADGQVERCRELRIPGAPMDVQQAGRGGVRDLGDLRARQPRAEQVRDQQHPPGGLEGSRPARGDELVERVERHDLEAVPGIQRIGRDDAMDRVDPGGVARIAVVEGIADQAAGPIEEAVVDRPRIDPDADQSVRGRRVRAASRSPASTS